MNSIGFWYFVPDKTDYTVGNEVMNIQITDSSFHDFQQVLDSQMNALKASGKFEKKQVLDTITFKMEDKLWEGVLDDNSPGVLLNNAFYYTGLCFALQRGEEHGKLWHNPGQIISYLVLEPTDGPGYLVYY